MSCVLIAQDTRVRKWSPMTVKPVKVGIVAPACRLDAEVARVVEDVAVALYGARVSLMVHPQCHFSAGHFAGNDQSRASAFVEVANDPSIDAVWFARGGYGSVRMVDMALSELTAVAKTKTYLGFSDLGYLMGALYSRGFEKVVHGPMPADILRPGGRSAVERALSYLVDMAPTSIDPAALSATKVVAFNLTILSHLIGTAHMPHLSGHVVMLEEVSEYMYRIDRSLAHITSCEPMRGAAGIRLGRCSQVPPNDPAFGLDEVQVVQHWCKVSGIPYLGRADIGHDVDNKVVPFGSVAMLS
jgi:muramoyltetrapeptide carboxypeptidase